AAFLEANGVKAAAYHAGMEKPRRTAVQNDFAREALDVVVATVAFGMGIDRSNVRCVVHAAMPKTIEHYQQETGRAGRDGLEAECVLFYSAADAMKWERLLERSAEKAQEPAEVLEAQVELLRHMQGLCGTLECRHRALSRYFGQAYEAPNCGACDVCLDEVESMDDSTTIAQKILSGVYRTGQRFGVKYIVDVLRGADTEQVRQRRHNELSTYGILDDMPEKPLTNLVYQLVDQGLLMRTGGDRPVVQLSEDSMPVLRGERAVHLVEPKLGPVRKAALAEDAWEGVDEALFERLRDLRRQIARDRGVPAYVILGDATLRELARIRPSSLARIGRVRGIGEKKLADLGERLVKIITEHCRQRDLAMDVAGSIRPTRPKRSRPNTVKDRAMRMFAEGKPVEEVARETGRAASTIYGYLAEYIQKERPQRIDAWVAPELYQRIIEAATAVASEGRLKPIYDHLEGEVPYEILRLVITHHRVTAAEGTAETRSDKR
ncbi:MAG: RQC domain-containing protein, partial [Planctomycetota bacterium]|nr:RQC domain-containing protein [Planctomycetota bacterium]